MNNFRLDMSAGFIMLISALIFFDDSGLISALILAAALHELGHYLALCACGVSVTGLNFRVSGVV